MTTRAIIKALRCFASLKEGRDPMQAIEDCPLTVLREAADQLENLLSCERELLYLQSHVRSLYVDAQRWANSAIKGARLHAEQDCRKRGD